MPTEMELTLEQTQQGVSYEVSNIRVNSFTMKMEILLEPTSNKLMVEHAEYDESNTYVLERFNTSAGNPVKKILLKLNLSDHRLCKMVVEVPDSSWLTRSITTCSYPTDKHKVIMKAQMLKITMSNTSSRNKLNPEINDHYNILTGECQKDELKTKDKAFSLLDIPIPHETPQILSPSVQNILVSMILKTTNLPPIPEIVTETLVTTADPSPQFTIKSTDKAALEEYDLKSALYQSMHANKVFNKNPANHRLYHALMEALIEDENAMDKGVADTVKDHKRKHDDDEDDDDEDPPAGPNQGKKTKRRRTKESESLKKPSSTKETPKGKTPTKGSKTGKSTSANEPVEEPITDVNMDDAGDDLARDDDQPQATSKPKTLKTLNP
ncbi:hypothetical protein Tco_0516847 [Tanacetum coccineum]